jgi:hypothetical protein
VPVSNELLAPWDEKIGSGGVELGKLGAINQQFLDHRTLKNQDFGKVANHKYLESIEEMKHAGRLPRSSCGAASPTGMSRQSGHVVTIW